MLLSVCAFSGDEMMGSEERQPTEVAWSWSSIISGEAGERWTPDTKEKTNTGLSKRKSRMI